MGYRPAFALFKLGVESCVEDMSWKEGINGVGDNANAGTLCEL